MAVRSRLRKTSMSRCRRIAEEGDLDPVAREHMVAAEIQEEAALLELLAHGGGIPVVVEDQRDDARTSVGVGHG